MYVFCCVVIIVFFFFKQKTAYEMRISDWSSDVCSSDLERIAHHRHLVYAKPVEQGGNLVDPDLLVFDPALGIGIAKPEHVRRNDAKALRQFGNVEPPVGPGRDARTRLMDKQDRSSFSHIMVVRKTTIDHPRLAD